MDPDEPLFHFDDVSLHYGHVVVLDHVCAEVPAQGITAVVGPSGAGKSSLLRLCNRLEVPTTGHVLHRGRDLADLDPLELRRQVGMVFQTPALFGGTVDDNLAVAAADSRRDERLRALDLAAIGRDFLTRQADSLSGGEAQRVCLARTLLTAPEALLLDEPTSALDEGPKRSFEQTTRRLADGGIPVLWVSHELEQVRRVADHVLHLREGRITTGTATGARTIEHAPIRELGRPRAERRVTDQEDPDAKR
jgi:putative ABC transport system ATP-binding protein